MSVAVSTIAERALRRINVAVVPLDDRPVLTEMVAVVNIALAALVELGVIAAEESPSTADLTFMQERVASVHAALDAQGIVWWTGDAVPRAFAEEYTKLAAAQAASSFGKTTDPALVALLEGRIRRGAMGISSHDVAVEAVMAVHTDLVGRGIARWSSQDIPDAVGNSYVVLAADALAPLFERKTDPKDAAMAMFAILRYVALPTSGERVIAEYF